MKWKAMDWGKVEGSGGGEQFNKQKGRTFCNNSYFQYQIR